jgi:hypothetical protein
MTEQTNNLKSKTEALKAVLVRVERSEEELRRERLGIIDIDEGIANGTVIRSLSEINLPPASTTNIHW